MQTVFAGLRVHADGMCGRPERDYPQTPKSWGLLGLEEHGGLVNVDTAAAPYGGSRMLITSCDVSGGTDTPSMVGHCAVGECSNAVGLGCDRCRP